MATDHDQSFASNNEREDILLQLRDLVRREEVGGYGRKHCPFYNALSSIPVCKWWYQWVDHHSLTRESINVAYQYTHIHFARKHREQANITESEVHRIYVASLLIAINVLHPRTYEVVNEESIATTLSRELGDDSNNGVAALLDTKRDMLLSLEGHLHDVPTMHQFAYLFCKLHPLMFIRPNLFDYLYSVTRFQVERAFFHEILLKTYKPSVIAFAALLRLHDEDSCQYERLTEEILPILGVDERMVMEAIFVLENSISDIPQCEEFEAIMAASLAAHQFDDASISDVISHRPESPSGVDGV